MKSVFLRSFAISFIFVFCIIVGFLMSARAYEKTVETAYGEKKSATEISGGAIRIFDFTFEIF